MLTWKSAGVMKNKKGIPFSLEYTRLLVVEGANYYPFGVRVINEDLKKQGVPDEHLFKVFIKKDTLTWQTAESFLTVDPINDIKSRLEQADNNNIPFFMPDFSMQRGYAIV
jgi:hypothetical protein